MNKNLTTQEAAERLGVSAIRVRQLIAEGRLPAEKFGRDYMIREGDLKLVSDRKPGRPSKTQAKKKPSDRKIMASNKKQAK
jgi:excisionase family DNA binding protein